MSVDRALTVKIELKVPLTRLYLVLRVMAQQQFPYRRRWQNLQHHS
jgi:hypothetical protein